MLHRHLGSLAASCASLLLVAGIAMPAAAADPCQSAIVKSLASYKKAVLKAHSKCLDKENKLLVPAGSCPDAIADLAVSKANLKVKAKIASQCASVAQITGLGYPADCVYETGTQGAEAQCAALPVTSTDEFAECMKCWKGAQLKEFLAILYASNSVQECGGDLTDTSAECSGLDCTTPLPTQFELGDNAEGDCQRGIAKAGIKYFLKREKLIEKCLLKGCTAAQCLGGTCSFALTLPVQLQAAEASKINLIKNKCGNRDPVAVAPDNFCCKCGGNNCMNIPDRPTCEATVGCQVQEGKFCDVDLTCAPGPKTITWWETCPDTDSGTCAGGDPVTTLDELISCVDATADEITDDLLCKQFPGYPCPPPETTTTTVTTTTLP